MAKSFGELRAKMSPAARSASETEHRQLREEMSLGKHRAALQFGNIALPHVKVLGGGRAVKITQFSE